MIEENMLPSHVAIIMDGNGRWAKERHLPRIEGHRRGVESVRQVIQSALSRHIKVLTLFAFSTDNWKRPQKEISFLFDLFLNLLQTEVKALHQKGVRLQVIGDVTAVDPKIQIAIQEAETLTAHNTALHLNLAFNYSGRWDIVQACRKIARQVLDQNQDPETISEQSVAEHLSLAGLPEPDLLIRTSGELRISNFLLWDLMYTELYFTETYWPDFRDDAFLLALTDFARRQRRFGAVDA